ncbi:hypothetical protein BGX21_008483 [Mortierella sp. AD011]|nr:hypothetical protein BGX20_007103 [Mortierella sp. AD010]KAF9397811.1 hypothetical protein BGX21_008483 [Mortierella sp. AD011]
MNTMFHGGGHRVIPGELASKASKSCRKITETEFGKSTQGASGRKVDITIRVLAEGAWTGEIAVFECKPTVSDSICARQLKKSVQLNAAILLDLERQGLDIAQWFPIIAESRGMALDFYTLKRYDDILGVGRSTARRAWLPSHPSQLLAFLRSDTLHVLLGFRVGFERSSFHTTFAFLFISHPASALTPTPIACEVHRDSPTDSSLELLRPSTPTQRAPKRDHPFVLFTPSKLSRSNHMPDAPRSAKARGEYDDNDVDDGEDDEECSLDA